MEIHELLNKVKNNEIDIKEAEDLLKKLPYEDLGFAKLDHHRKLRSGFGEVIYCSGKSEEHLVRIFQNFNEKEIDVLGTRASKEQYELVKSAIPEAEYDELSRIIKIVRSEPKKQGCIAVCTGGTSDIQVAGLVDKPVIAVPTSIGYGANFGGLSALLTMLNSCAEGVSVVNIDNGFGAGYLSTQINRLVSHPREV